MSDDRSCSAKIVCGDFGSSGFTLAFSSTLASPGFTSTFVVVDSAGTSEGAGAGVFTAGVSFLGSSEVEDEG